MLTALLAQLRIAALCTASHCCTVQQWATDLACFQSVKLSTVTHSWLLAKAVLLRTSSQLAKAVLRTTVQHTAVASHHQTDLTWPDSTTGCVDCAAGCSCCAAAHQQWAGAAAQFGCAGVCKQQSSAAARAWCPCRYAPAGCTAMNSGLLHVVLSHSASVFSGAAV